VLLNSLRQARHIENSVAYLHHVHELVPAIMADVEVTRAAVRDPMWGEETPWDVDHENPRAFAGRHEPRSMAYNARFYPLIDALLKVQQHAILIHSSNTNDRLWYTGTVAVVVPFLANSEKQVSATGIRKRTNVGEQTPHIALRVARNRGLIVDSPTLRNAGNETENVLALELVERFLVEQHPAPLDAPTCFGVSGGHALT
jgi:hypothetical protein